MQNNIVLPGTADAFPGSSPVPSGQRPPQAS